MSNTRREYLEDLLQDCLDATESAGLDGTDGLSSIIAALIVADSINGLRKALLQLPRGVA